MSDKPKTAELIYDFPLAKLTSWRVGGPAKKFYKPKDLADLSRFFQNLKTDDEIFFIGLGSNLLIRDQGVNGLVILTLSALNQLEILQNNVLRAEAGVTCAKFAKFSAQNHFAGAAFFAGIPGTMGGALAMNAGAFAGETWRQVIAVEMINRQGEIILRQPDEFEVTYRQVMKPKDEWFVAGHFQFASGDIAEETANMKALLKKREIQQPIGQLSCGSVFRNPTGDYAARLIESCGLKNKRLGDAFVSEKHANFIINGGQAKANDIECLIHEVQQTVLEKTGIYLLPECHIIGEKS